MTPKKKALELFKKYSKGKDEHGWSLCEFDSCAKQCALIAVDEILNLCWNGNKVAMEYWQKVKQEIEKI